MTVSSTCDCLDDVECVTEDSSESPCAVSCVGVMMMSGDESGSAWCHADTEKS